MRKLGVFLLVPAFFYLLWIITGSFSFITLLQFVSLMVASLIAIFYKIDNKAKKRWFKIHKYGYEWYPISWQGWAVLTLLAGFMVLITLASDRETNSMGDTLQTALPFVALCIVIGVWVIYKTGRDNL